MDSSSSLGSQSGAVSQQVATSSAAAGDRSSSGTVVAGRKLYAFERGFCYIPKGDWTGGLEKQSGAPFYVSSLRHALIVPAGYAYPHLTLDVQEMYVQHKAPPHVKVRISHAHYSPGSRLPRLAFHCRGVQLFPDCWSDQNVLVKVQGYLERSPLPFQVAESFIVAQPETALVAAVEGIGLEASSSAPASARQDQQEELSRVESPDTSSSSSAHPGSKRQKTPKSTRSKILKGTASGVAAKQARADVKSAPGAEVVANVVRPEEDTEKLWLDALNRDNFLEALDTLTVHQFNEEELGFAVIFYRLGVENKEKKAADYGDKVTERGKAVMDALANSASLINKAAQQRGAKGGSYRQAAQRSTLKSVAGSQLKVEENVSTSLSSQEALDYGLHLLVPSDLIDDRLRPVGDNPAKFRGYQCAMLLLFRMLAMDCYQVRCQEFFSRVHYLLTQILMVCDAQAPASVPYFYHIKTYLRAVQAEIIKSGSARRAQGDVNADLLRRHQDSIEPFREWYEQALQMSYDLTSVLADISNQLPAMSQRDWRHLTHNIQAEMERVATRDEKNQQHWQEAVSSIERVRDEFVNLVQKKPE